VEVIFLLIPLALVLVGFVVWAFWWAIRSGQFDDMEGPAHRILMDDEKKRHKKGEGSDNQNSS
jgi:cbb3-type cytochrome oxidase maturation protein